MREAKIASMSGPRDAALAEAEAEAESPPTRREPRVRVTSTPGGLEATDALEWKGLRGRGSGERRPEKHPGSDPDGEARGNDNGNVKGNGNCNRPGDARRSDCIRDQRPETRDQRDRSVIDQSEIRETEKGPNSTSSTAATQVVATQQRKSQVSESRV